MGNAPSSCSSCCSVFTTRTTAVTRIAPDSTRDAAGINSAADENTGGLDDGRVPRFPAVARPQHQHFVEYPPRENRRRLSSDNHVAPPLNVNVASHLLPSQPQPSSADATPRGPMKVPLPERHGSGTGLHPHMPAGSSASLTALEPPQIGSTTGTAIAAALEAVAAAASSSSSSSTSSGEFEAPVEQTDVAVRGMWEGEIPHSPPPKKSMDSHSTAAERNVSPFSAHHPHNPAPAPGAMRPSSAKPTVGATAPRPKRSAAAASTWDNSDSDEVDESDENSPPSTVKRRATDRQEASAAEGSDDDSDDDEAGPREDTPAAAGFSW